MSETEKIFIKKAEPINRKDKRQYEKELLWLKKWNDEVVIPLEIEFWHELKGVGMDYPTFDHVQYLDVYQRYLDKFTSARDKMNHIRLKFQFIDINLFYFENLYKPLENV